MILTPTATMPGLTRAQLISLMPSQYNAISKDPDYYLDGILIQNDQINEVG